MIASREELTPREREQMDHEREMFGLQAEHTKIVKSMELEVAKIEARWSVLLKLPLTIVKLPLYVIMGIAYCIAVARKVEPSEHFWHLLR